MSRKGYHLLATEFSGSDSEEKVTFVSGNGWSDEEQNLNVFADSKNEKSKNAEIVELRSRNSFGTGKAAVDEANVGPSTSETAPRRSNGSGNNNGTILLERRVRKDDTLQKISLQFSVSVADLKRINGFIADTDLYARDIVKIPVSKYGYNHALLMAELDGAIPATIEPSSSVHAPVARPTISTVPGEPVQAENLLKAVDENVLKAQRQLEQRQQEREVNAENSVDDESHFSYSTWRSRNAGHWLERNVCHFLLLVLIIFVVVGLPVLLIFYWFNTNGDSTNFQNHSQHDH